MTVPDEKLVRVSVSADHVLVSGADLTSNRTARLFFRSFLGGESTADGWRCPRRQLDMRALLLRVHDWLSEHGYAVTSGGEAELSISRELERRRSFVRTRDAARSLQESHNAFDFSLVEAALNEFGWSTDRDLRPHQRDGVAHALTAVNAANFSVPGSGKTAVALATAVTHLRAETIDLIVVVGPVASFDPWEQETLAAVGHRIRTRRARGTARNRAERYAQAQRGDLILLTFASAANDQPTLIELFNRWRVMLIVDESHRMKRFRGGVWAPALTELARRARVRMILSGTPMPQSGTDLYSQLNVIWPDEQLTGTRDAFAAKVTNDFSSLVHEIGPFMSRTPKHALGLEPPKVLRHDVELIGTQREIYELVANRLRQQIKDADSWQDKLDALRRARPIRLLQAAANPDLFNAPDAYYRLPRLPSDQPTLMERLASYRSNEVPAKSLAALALVAEITASNGKVVCWSNFIRNLDQFAELVRTRLGLRCFQIDGRVPIARDALRTDPLGEGDESSDPPDTRERVIQEFLRHDGPAVLVTNPASCSESISLHSSCHNAIYLDRTYDCALFLQSIDRIHRLGLPPGTQVTVHLLNATIDDRPTVDQLVDQAIEAKSDRMRQLLEGAEIAPMNLSDDPLVDAEGTAEDLTTLLRFLLGEEV